MPWELDHEGIHMQASSLCKHCINKPDCETRMNLEITVSETLKQHKRGNGKLIVVECSRNKDERDVWP